MSSSNQYWIDDGLRFLTALLAMLGFKSFETANATISGIELHHMLKKGQMFDLENIPAWQ